jgi:chemotaxis protein MotB
MAEVEQPIIKKVTIVSGGHHGGAWKVAYADFVTAMMAFFLLLWLLATASEETKEGLSEYFAPTVGISGAEGIGFKGGKTTAEDGEVTSDKTPVALVVGQAPPGMAPGAPEKESLIEAEEEANLFEKAAKEIKKAFEEDPSLSDLKDNIMVEQRPEGLKIEMLDSDRKAMFEEGGAVLSEFGKIILGRISELVQRMPNYISITGHTDKSGYDKEEGAESNWELSSARANSARRFMISTDMKPMRVAKVVGRADRELLLPDIPLSPRNRRVTIVLLRGLHMMIPLDQQAAPRSLLSTSRSKRKSDDAFSSSAPEAEPETPESDLPDGEAPAIQLDNESLNTPSDFHKPKDGEELPPMETPDNLGLPSIESTGTIH